MMDKDALHFVNTWFPLGLENLEKSEKDRLEKLKKILEKSGKSVSQ